MSNNPGPNNAGTTTDVPNPAVTSHFSVEVDGIQMAVFKEADGFSNESEVITHVVTDKAGKTIYQKVPGNMKWTDLILKRGMAGDDSLWQWRQAIIDGKVSSNNRKTVTIVAYNQDDQPIISYVAQNAWPSAWKATGVNAAGNEVMVEEVTLAHEGLSIKK